ncbi:MAG: putative choline transporter, neither null mutation nor overexpression affects choline transport [Phylliscum demangeonii]|nr:MAG: putative choline transporter, neither null mutation nor overexpression affects choline transport [Phylliscum demangeonii]
MSMPPQPQYQGPPPMQYPPQAHLGQEYQQEPKYPQPPPSYGQNLGPANAPPPIPGNKPTFAQAFKLEKPGFKDLWAGILLIITFGGFVAVSALTIQGYAATKKFNGGGIYGSSNNFGLSTNTIVLFAFVLLLAFALSWAYFTLARAFTKQFIWITGILQIVFGIGTAIVYFARHYYSAAIVFLVFSVFYIFCFISWIPRIPFSVLVLQTVMDVAKHHGHIFLASFIGGLVSLAFGAWFSVTLTSIYVKYQPGNNPACHQGAGGCSSAKVIGLVVFITFAGYWISEWIRQTLHTTIAGVYGNWYFNSRKAGGAASGATRGAFRRAITYSFGSISLGSLFASVVQLLRQAATLGQQSEAQQGDTFGAIMFCVLGCFISILDWAVQFINHYAFSYIALYGKSYFAAAKDTWRMMKDRGIDALVNDCLIDPVITMGSTFVGYLCSFLAYLYLEFTKPAYNHNGTFTPVVMAFSFLIGVQICNVFMTPLKSGTATFFVAAAFDPEVLMRDFPELWARMVAVYPRVQQAIHV